MSMDNLEIEKELEKYYEIARDFIIPDYGKVKYHVWYIADRLCSNDCGWYRYNRSVLDNGLSIEQVQDLEEQCGVKFPPSFFEFMLVTGKSWRDLIYSESAAETAEHLLELQNFPNRYTNEDFSIQYPQDIFIISTEHSGLYLFYFKKSEFNLEDPPIYLGEVGMGEFEELPYKETQRGKFTLFIEESCRRSMARNLNSKRHQ